MDNKKLKEWADFMGVSVEDAKKLREKGIEERKKHNKFEAEKGDGRFIPQKVKK